MKQAIKNFFKSSNLLSVKKLLDTEYELEFKSRVDDNSKDTYIFEIRQITDNRAIALLFEINTSSILFHKQLVNISYKGSMTNTFEIIKTCDGYEIKHLDMDYLWYNEVIESKANKQVIKKELSIK